MACGVYLWSDWRVRPGKLVMKPALRAAASVAGTGEKSVAWANWTKSAVDGSPMWLALWMDGVGVVADGDVKYQRPVVGRRVPMRMTVLLSRMRTWWRLNVTV